MKTEIIHTTTPDAIERAASVLRAGGLIAFPTDTVYGLAALPFDPAGILRLYAAKGRDATKAIPILIGKLAQLEQIANEFTPAAQRLALRYWPGALTIVVSRHPALPAELSALPTIGVRMPDHPFALALLRAVGALAVTSANLSGGENPRNAQDVLAQLDGHIELILDGGETPVGVPSTVVDCTTPQARILRQGAIPAEDIMRLVLDQ